MYTAEDGMTILSYAFHPGEQFDQTMDTFGRDKMTEVSVDSSGQAFYVESVGLFYHESGKDWFVQVIAMPPPDQGFNIGEPSVEHAKTALGILLGNM